MIEKEDKDIEALLADIITARPHEVRVGGKALLIYPVTLAKTFMLRPWMDALKLDSDIMRADPFVECLRIAGTQPDIVAHILTIHTAPNSYNDLHDSIAAEERYRLLYTVKPEHLAGLLMVVLTQDNTEQIARYLGIEDEQKKLREVMKVRKGHEKNNKNYGGVSVFGSFIGQLKEMGYNDDEILFERPYSYLRLMLADKVTNIYLSDEDLESLPTEAGGTLLDGEDDASFDVLSSLIRNGGTK